MLTSTLWARVNPRVAMPVFFGLALIMCAAAVLLYVAFVCPAARVSESGVITAKQILPARTIVRRQASPRRELWTTNEFELPDRIEFQIRLERSSEQVRYALPVNAAAGYEVGQQVNVTYERRSIPLIWSRVYVREMTPAE
ncbi:MAG: hypothetical protein LC130_34790 [Bryobacterales bacterium]|nr:hypothetical protein [Bryobacterales bacterium]MEB2363169.1 hypothetical protein [Bryobacterales bacterium]